ncbi:MAG: hypothetical protein ACHQ1H_10340 [Nitrososphaerales archaeon]
MKLRLLLMGCILIIIGTVLYVARGLDTLLLALVGIVLLIGRIIYPNRVKQKEVMHYGNDGNRLVEGRLDFGLHFEEVPHSALEISPCSITDIMSSKRYQIQFRQFILFIFRIPF